MYTFVMLMMMWLFSHYICLFREYICYADADEAVFTLHRCLYRAYVCDADDDVAVSAIVWPVLLHRNSPSSDGPVLEHRNSSNNDCVASLGAS